MNYKYRLIYMCLFILYCVFTTAVLQVVNMQCVILLTVTLCHECDAACVFSLAMNLIFNLEIHSLFLLWVKQPPSNEQKTAQIFCCTWGGGGGVCSPIKWYNKKKEKERSY